MNKTVYLVVKKMSQGASSSENHAQIVEDFGEIEDQFNEMIDNHNDHQYFVGMPDSIEISGNEVDVNFPNYRACAPDYLAGWLKACETDQEANFETWYNADGKAYLELIDQDCEILDCCDLDSENFIFNTGDYTLHIEAIQLNDFAGDFMQAAIADFAEAYDRDGVSIDSGLTGKDRYTYKLQAYATNARASHVDQRGFQFELIITDIATDYRYSATIDERSDGYDLLDGAVV